MSEGFNVLNIQYCKMAQNLFISASRHLDQSDDTLGLSGQLWLKLLLYGTACFIKFMKILPLFFHYVFIFDPLALLSKCHMYENVEFDLFVLQSED